MKHNTIKRDQMHSDKAERIFEELRSPQRLILYCLGSVSKPMKNELSIQKLIFLCNSAAPEIFGDTFRFRQHKQGPYSAEINETLNIFKDEGLIRYTNSLTPDGMEVFKLIRIADRLRHVVDDYGNFISNLTDDEIMTFVYVTDPKQRKESEEWGRLKSHRFENAVSLLKKEKISFSKAAEIAGMDLDDFEDELIKNKIKWRSAE